MGLTRFSPGITALFQESYGFRFFSLCLSLIDLLPNLFPCRVGAESPTASSAYVQSFPPRHLPSSCLSVFVNSLPGFNSGASQLCIHSFFHSSFLDLVLGIVMQSGVNKTRHLLKWIMGCDDNLGWKGKASLKVHLLVSQDSRLKRSQLCRYGKCVMGRGISKHNGPEAQSPWLILGTHRRPVWQELSKWIRARALWKDLCEVSPPRSGRSR